MDRLLYVMGLVSAFAIYTGGGLFPIPSLCFALRPRPAHGYLCMRGPSASFKNQGPARGHVSYINLDSTRTGNSRLGYVWNWYTPAPTTLNKIEAFSPIVWPKQPKNKPKFEFLNLILKLILKCF
jgi:hypothetical protein